MPTNINETKNLTEIMWQQIPELKNITLFWQSLKFVLLNVLPKLYSNKKG